MQDIPLFARQPIFDAELNVVAHELLFRGDPTTGEAATAEVIVSAFDQSLFDVNAGGLPVFINFPADILLHMPLLDKNKLVVEILEDVTVTPELVEAVGALHAEGYKIALDDYVHCAEFAPLLHHADIIKLDVLETTGVELETVVLELRHPKRKLLAEKVENHAVYTQCRSLGMHYYQGFFFAKPNIVHGKAVTADAATVLNLLAALQQPDITPERLENVILSDTVLTYRIVKLVNSAAYRRANEITSVASAITLLGMRQVSAFATLLSLSTLKSKPAELAPYTSVRAHFCQTLGEILQIPFAPESLFTLGVLSCSDAYFDQPMAKLATNLPLHADFKSALLHRDGLLGALLELAQHYQEGEWADINWENLHDLGITRALADAAFQTSLTLASDTAAIVTASQ